MPFSSFSLLSSNHRSSFLLIAHRSTQDRSSLVAHRSSTSVLQSSLLISLRFSATRSAVILPCPPLSAHRSLLTAHYSCPPPLPLPLPSEEAKEEDPIVIVQEHAVSITRCGSPRQS